MDVVAAIFAAFAALVIVAVLVSQVRQVTVYQFQHGLRYRSGRFVGLVGPGRHWLVGQEDQIRTVDARAAVMAMLGQELVTSDGISVKITLAITRQVVDPDTAVNKFEDWATAMYTAVQVALREVVTGMTIDDVLARRSEIGGLVQALAVEKVRALGVELQAVDVRDLMLPAQTKRILSQVVEARQRGLAALEKARGETAALRSLANAARMVDANPSLLQLRILQQVESTSGNTFLGGMPPSTTPLPVRQVGATGGEEAAPPTEPDRD